MALEGPSRPSPAPGHIAEAWSRFVLRLVLTVFVSAMVSIVAGLGFFLMFIGLYMSLSRLAIYWQPARRLVGKLIPFPDASVYEVRITLTWWRVLILVAHLLFGLGAFAIGITVILEQGLCGQNLFCD